MLSDCSVTLQTLQRVCDMSRVGIVVPYRITVKYHEPCICYNHSNAALPLCLMKPCQDRVCDSVSLHHIHVSREGIAQALLEVHDHKGLD